MASAPNAYWPLSPATATAAPEVHGQVSELTVALLASSRPRSAVHWLRTSGGGRILACLAADREPITHPLLDQLPPSRELHRARRLTPDRQDLGLPPDKHACAGSVRAALLCINIQATRLHVEPTSGPSVSTRQMTAGLARSSGSTVTAMPRVSPSPWCG
jgi:hypothetical protein